MESRLTFYRLVVLVLSVLGVFASLEFTAFRSLPELRMELGVPLKRVKLSKCCAICAKSDSCISVNYHRPTSVCEINSLKMKMGVWHLTQAAGWKVYEKLPCGLGYKTGQQCHYFQNMWDAKSILTHEKAKEFCSLLGTSLSVLTNQQEADDFKSDAELANVASEEWIWLNEKQGDQCLCIKMFRESTHFRPCTFKRSVVCERRTMQ